MPVNKLTLGHILEYIIPTILCNAATVCFFVVVRRRLRFCLCRENFSKNFNYAFACWSSASDYFPF